MSADVVEATSKTSATGRGVGGLFLKALRAPRRLRNCRREIPANVRNPWPWTVRRFLSPIKTVNCRVRLDDGAVFQLAHDRLDDRIIEDTYGPFAPLFFPAELAQVPSDALILDVGAHHGVYTVAMLRRYPSARIIAIEPDPVGAGMLRHNVALNGLESRVEVVEAAIGTRDGVGSLEQSDEGSWGNRIVAKDGSPNAVTVRTSRLATILRGRSPQVVKSNCEGGEFALVPQLFELGLRPTLMILLTHPTEGSTAQLLELVRAHGYRVASVAGDEIQPRFVCSRAN
jgi:FkbM family methyltransferase